MHPYLGACYTVNEVIGLDINKIFELKIVNIFLPIICNISFGCSKEPSHWDGSFEYPQHMFLLRNRNIIFGVFMLNLSPGSSTSGVCEYVVYMNMWCIWICYFLSQWWQENPDLYGVRRSGRCKKEPTRYNIGVSRGLQWRLHRPGIKSIVQVHAKLHNYLFISTCSLHWNIKK